MNDDEKKNELEININLDTTPVLYTDNVIMTTNEDGVVLDICQKIGNTNKARIVARVGMSKEHAKKFLKKLAQLLDQSEGRIETGKVHRA